MGIRLIADSCCDTGPQTDKRLRDLSKAPLQVLVEEQAFVAKQKCISCFEFLV